MSEQRILHLTGEPSKWVESLGGPLVLMDSDSCERWLMEEHYEASCTVEGWLGILDMPWGEVLVISGEPAPAWWQNAEGVRGVLFRWIHGPEGYMPRGSITLPPEKAAPDEILANRGPVYLCDAALDGEYSLEDEEGLLIPLRRGPTVVETYEYTPEEETCMMVHVFI